MNTPFADCPISQPIFHPELESVTFNGFAWSDTNGIILQSITTDPGNSNNWTTGPS